jgi:hypothetical protein
MWTVNAEATPPARRLMARWSPERILMWLVGSYLAVAGLILLLTLAVPYPLIFLAIPTFPMAMLAVTSLVGLSAGRRGPCWLLVGCQATLSVVLLILLVQNPHLRQGLQSAGYTLVAGNSLFAAVVVLCLLRFGNRSAAPSPQMAPRATPSASSRRTVNGLIVFALLAGVVIFGIGAAFDLYAHSHGNHQSSDLGAAFGDLLGVPVMIFGGSTAFASVTALWLRRQT